MRSARREQQAAQRLQAGAAEVGARVDRQLSSSGQALRAGVADVRTRIDAMSATQPALTTTGEADRLRKDQERQLKATGSTADRVLRALSDGARELERAGAQPEDVRRLDETRAQTTRDLQQLEDRLDTTLKTQRQESLGAAADGSLQGRAAELVERRAQDASTLRNDAAALEDRVADALRTQGLDQAADTAVAGRREIHERAHRPLDEEQLTRLRDFTERVGQLAAALLRGARPWEQQPGGPSVADRERQRTADALRSRFAPLERTDPTGAGSAFHEMSKVAAEALRGQVPPGWRMDVDKALADGTRPDLRFSRPGAEMTMDWKTTARSATQAADQMDGYRRMLSDEQQRQHGVGPSELQMQQESRHWREMLARLRDPAQELEAAMGQRTGDEVPDAQEARRAAQDAERRSAAAADEAARRAIDEARDASDRLREQERRTLEEQEE